DIEGKAHHRLIRHHRRAVRHLVPPLEQRLGMLGHHRRVGGDGARIEGWRHDAAVPSPGLALRREETLADAGLKKAPRKTGADVIVGIVKQHALDRVRVVDDPGLGPQERAVEEFFLIGVPGMGRDRTVAYRSYHLEQAEPALGRLWRGENRASGGGVERAHFCPWPGQIAWYR